MKHFTSRIGYPALRAGLVVAALIAAGAASTPARADPPPMASKPADAAAPGRLPGDNPPPRWMLLKPPPVPTPGHPGPDMRNKAIGPSFAQALHAARAALAYCAAKRQAVGVTVIDSSGQPRVALVADGALGGHVYTAVRKGLAALAFKEPTSRVSEQLAAGRIPASRISPDMVPWAGAVPLWQDGRIIGAIAVSGSVSEMDEACARAGAAALGRSAGE
jgi:glc operon protein GlcG